MNLFTVDPDKCDRDGICLSVCPFGLLEVTAENTPPSPVPGAEERCINCGHCVTVCPQGALALKTMGPNDCTPIREGLRLSREQAGQFLSARRSIRVYKDKSVPRDTLKELIKLASYAPSGHNLQLSQWLIIENRKEIKRIGSAVVDWLRSVLKEKPEFARLLDADIIIDTWERGEDTIFRGAPHLIIVHAPDSYRNLQTVRSQFIIALAYLELAAASFGLGTCWAGYFMAALQLYPPVNEVIKLPKGHMSYGGMMVGYPKFKYHRIPLKNEPKITWI